MPRKYEAAGPTSGAHSSMFYLGSTADASTPGQGAGPDASASATEAMVLQNAVPSLPRRATVRGVGSFTAPRHEWSVE